MFRTIRMIATATITLWAAGAGAQNASAPASAPEAAPPAVAPPPATPQVAPQVTPQPAPQQGTPATVLDTQDYESLLGKGVRGLNGDELGRVIDIIIDKDGRPRAAIIDFGGFLGVGSRKIAVDWRALRFTTDGKPGRLVLQLSRNQVRVSPEYKPGEPIVVLGPASPGGTPEGEAAAQPAGQPPGQAPAPAGQPPAAQAPVAQPAPAQPAATPPAEGAKPPERAPDR
ncbi:PRC-barrel domain-containing protein [Methylobacterium sp. A54F]